MRNKLLKISFIALSLLVIGLVNGLDSSLATVHYEIESSKVAKTIKIAVVADLHSCNYGEGQKELLDAIRQANPDIVVMVGDIVDDVLPQDNAKVFMGEVGKFYPCYYVSGNHEYWSGYINEIKSLVEGYNIQVLEGDLETMTVNGQTIAIGGIDDPDLGHSIWQNQLSAVNDLIDAEIYTVLLSHRPEKVETYNNCDFDLVLSGHAHGGQWRLPGIINGLLAPNQGLFPVYAGGLYTFEQQQMVVSRGLAKESTRIPRLYNRPELVIVTLN